jgi:hypothetical protein
MPKDAIGYSARNAEKEKPDAREAWILGHQEQFRELADPTVLWHEGNWYLYPTGDLAWISADNGATRQHHPLNVRDVGPAPPVVRHRGRLLLAASGPAIYAWSSPLGFFEKIGNFPAVGESNRTGHGSRQSQLVDP